MNIFLRDGFLTFSWFVNAYEPEVIARIPHDYYVDGKRVSEFGYFLKEWECSRFECMRGETMKNGRRKFCKSGTVEK